MDMIVFVSMLLHLAFEVLAHVREDIQEQRKHPCSDDLAAILWHEDQMRIQVVDDMSPPTKLLCTWHRPSYT